MTKQQLIEENRRLREQNGELKLAYEYLKFEMEALKRLVFGQKSERFIASEIPAEQLSLFRPEATRTENPAAGPVTETISYERKKPTKKEHPGRNPIPEHFPVEEEVIEPEEDTTGLVKIGEERTEYVEYTPASLVKKVIIRPKYARPLPDGSTRVLVATLPGRPIEKSIAGVCLLAWIIISKFVDHLPFYRQIKRLAREYNWILAKSTFSDWFAACCVLLRPLYEHIVRQTLTCGYLQGDESRIQVMSQLRCDAQGKRIIAGKKTKLSKPGKTHQGWMWVVHSPVEKLVVFNYEKGRGKEDARVLLDGFKGYLQVDGYDGYNGIAATEGVTRVGCWAHARRKFFEALKNDRKRSGYALTIIQQVYTLEDKCRDLSVEERKAYRDTHIRPLLDGFKDWLDKEAPYVTPKSPIGKAFTYSQNQWPYLYAILRDGRLKLDNNLIENKIRPLALGRKNFLFAGSHDAAQRIAMMYTFLGTCAARGVNPYEWLKSTLEKIPETKMSELHTLVPGYMEGEV